ncbi:MAG: Gfo/Idh/MocA family oxidoreductase [Candidatus Omnitrophica bacterium]|nr:Gfo/Idh/MocA family oxidoreductase [Candidatus Omnitrophota bacterium]
MSENKCSRRIFLMGSAAATMAGCATTRTSTVPSLKRLGYKSPNEKLNMAAIGAGGKGGGDIGQCGDLGENIIALCDPDQRQAAGSIRKFPNARLYADYREMLDKEKTLDACTISTPDHVHAVAAIDCMKRGIHVYCQKPLTRTIWEARRLTEVARETGVSTQMGNQGHSGDGVRDLCEMVWAGIAGNIREVHAWTNRPIWPQGIEGIFPDGKVGLLPEEEIPEHVDWEAWLGPMPYRPYNSAYMPFKWRGWWDFGGGALADMACHILDPANWALCLTNPDTVECLREEGNNEQTFPTKSIIRFTFPRRGSMPPLTLYWYDGDLHPPIPEGVDPAKLERRMRDGSSGSIFIGDKGVLYTGTYGGGSELVAGEHMKDFEKPQEILPRLPGGDDDVRQKIDWIRACKGGAKAGSNFEYSGPLTEWVVMGNLCLKFPQQKLFWDAEKLKFTNCPEANQWVKPHFRKGWTL